MEIKINEKDGILSFSHKLKKNETYRVSKNKKFFSLSIYKKPQILKGIASFCSDNKHCIFIDYDDVPRWLVEQDFSLIQEMYDLPQAYLLSTSEREENGEVFGNWHVICLSKHTPKVIYEILSKTHADVNFMSMPLRRSYRDWVLRISDKRRKERPKFVKVIGKENNSHLEVSKPHLDFLKKIYPLPEINYRFIDNLKKVYLQTYQAS